MRVAKGNLYETPMCLRLGTHGADEKQNPPTIRIQFYMRNMILALDQLGNRTQAIECAKAALKILEDIEDHRTDSV